VTEPLNLLGSTMRRFDINMEVYAGPDGRSVETADCTRSGAKDGARLCRVPAGDFIMGASGGAARADEGPQRTVSLSRSFDAYATEVTVAMYRKCVEAGGCKAPGLEIRGSAAEPARENAVAAACNFNAAGRGDAPMNCVNHYGAQAYCSWAGGSLPTEAQWEYAARGADGRPLPWGATPAGADGCDYAGFAGCSDTPPGGSVVGEHALGRSPFGLSDTAGNVAEWVRDTYESGAYATLSKIDPLSDTALSRRVVRGGSAQEFATRWSITSRSRLDANARVAHVGFRCVVEAP
jgi:formylglycine-generating enzyme required for sulfatase activity